jgi:NAD-dependent deacetylase
LDTEVGRAADLLKRAKHGVALTGAGVSTRSGIPDFRTPGSGLWSKADPTQVASIDAFMRDPRAYYEWRRPLLKSMRQVQPNPAHRALAELEQREILRAIITQNIDGLHQRAGSQRVLEVHGAAHEVVCLSCRQIFREDANIWRTIDKGEVPYCSLCGGLLKPNVVLFGERLPLHVVSQVDKEIAECDVILVAGSSLLVQPACWWPEEAMRHGAQAIIVNLTETHLDASAAVVIRGDVAEALPAIVEALAGA